jgi:hypothetical protein
MSKVTTHSELARLDASNAAGDFAHALNHVTYRGERVILQRRGKDVAALISIEDLAILEVAEDLRGWGRPRTSLAAARCALTLMGTQGDPSVSPGHDSLP